MTDVRFVGDMILQDSSAYKFRYNPEENPKRPIIKRGSCFPNYVWTPTSHSSHGHSQNTESDLAKRKKRMSYDFLNLKNVDGKVIKHWQ